MEEISNHKRKRSPELAHDPEAEVMREFPPAQRYLLHVEYFGKSFFGWQKQKNCRTIQGDLEEALRRFTGEPTAVVGSSRTDTGVHALGNTCHVDILRRSSRRPNEEIPPYEASVVRKATNHFLKVLGGEVSLVSVHRVPSDFHARFHATERTYHYRLLCGGTHCPLFEQDRVWHIPEALSLPAMQKACKILEGTHDFSSFRATGCQASSPLRTVDELSVTPSSTWNGTFPAAEERQELKGPTLQPGDGGAGEGAPAVRPHCLVVTARARSFLYHQVRLLVGVLKAVGAGDLAEEDVRAILQAKDITRAPAMAPAWGLYLSSVNYDKPLGQEGWS